MKNALEKLLHFSKKASGLAATSGRRPRGSPRRVRSRTWLREGGGSRTTSSQNRPKPKRLHLRWRSVVRTSRKTSLHSASVRCSWISSTVGARWMSICRSFAVPFPLFPFLFFAFAMSVGRLAARGEKEGDGRRSTLLHYDKMASKNLVFLSDYRNLT